MKSFDRSALTKGDYHGLAEAVARAAPRLRFCYHLPNVWRTANSAIGHGEMGNIAIQTGAVSDYDKWKDHRDFLLADDNKRVIEVVPEPPSKLFTLKGLLGIRDINIVVYNSSNALPLIRVGRRAASLVKIVGFNWGNTYQAIVDLEHGTAFLDEEDQDLAHKVGLMYAPSGIIEAFALTPSDPNLHKAKPRTDSHRETILYCDNGACQQRVRNPVLVVDEQTGGLYHNDFCFQRDMGEKRSVAREKYDITINPTPRNVTLETAMRMYQQGELQQSLHHRNAMIFS